VSSQPTTNQPATRHAAGDAAPDAGPAFDDAALRADIRRLGNLLGDTLTRQEGPELLALVERVRAAVRASDDSVEPLLSGLDVPTAEQLVRAFSTYFHLANVTEQVHRGRELARRRRERGGWLARAGAAIRAAGIERGEV
jgi:phosphoenolpyruvate carboxylase